jgi:4-alpha-glucanotransferase
MTLSRELQDLADAYGVDTWYHDDKGTRIEASPEALLTILGVLGAPLKTVDDSGSALRQRRQDLWRRVMEPVCLAWDGWPRDVTLKLPSREANSGSIDCRLEIENGPVHEWSAKLVDLPFRESAEIEGVGYTVRTVPLIGPMPLGYHRLQVKRGAQAWETLLLAAPTKSYIPMEQTSQRTWGVFLPTYAIRSARNWGVGDFTDLENLILWVQKLGGGLVGTLPLLAAFLDEPFEPSPYSPASRMFWNEFYLDPERAPEFAACPEAKAFLGSPAFQKVRQTAQQAELIDYKPLAETKRRVLEMLARQAFAAKTGRRQLVEDFARTQPRAEDYARFRAVGEKRKATWWNWPERLRGGDLQAGDYDETARQYHLYVQFLAKEQLNTVAETAGKTGPGLYLDLPLGVNADSYDVWRERRVFALGVSGGAPPDAFFSKGQDWGFPPIHPENLRAQGYRYLRDCLSHHMKLAGMLRIDHVMGLHRLYWVPRQLGAKQGVYVRYPAEEIYAVYALESNRNQTILVGEDLGTVPDQVRPAMAKHEVRRLYVGQFEMEPDPKNAVHAPVPGVVASMNTHDTPTFSGFWRGLDIEDCLAMGLFDEEGAQEARERRVGTREAVVAFLREKGTLGKDDDSESAVLRATLEFMAAGDAGFVLATLEDLWQAPQPQNVPGTWREKPNWRRRAAHGMEEYDKLPAVRATLLAIDRAMRGRPKAS